MKQVLNPPNPYLKYSAEFLGEPPAARLEVYEEATTRSMISKSTLPPLGVRYTVNCYRGCIHACTYCFARRYHEFLGYGAGTDFETKIVVKTNAPEVLRADLKKTKEKINHLEFSFATDPYLPLEANYELTRRCLTVCRDFRMPVAVITKSPLVTRDIDILKQLKSTVFFSIPFPTVEKSRPFELHTPTPAVRFRAMKTLSDAGLRVGIAIAPIILGYNDADIPALLERARENGATKAFINLIHIDSDSIEEYFVGRLRERLPLQADKIINQQKRERGGTLRHQTFADRAGRTEKWQTAVKLFELHFRRLGFERFEKPEPPENAPETPAPVQGKLF
ncbi:MAG: radical SAM protein [Acidobacteria bacterium]|nr:radical SAM protein [Acidobacteriota bacterium]